MSDASNVITIIAIAMALIVIIAIIGGAHRTREHVHDVHIPMAWTQRDIVETIGCIAAIVVIMAAVLIVAIHGSISATVNDAMRPLATTGGTSECRRHAVM